MHETLYQSIAAIGILIIILGNYLSLKNKTRKKFTYLFFTIGGVLLLAYSIYIKEPIFIVLQAIFIIFSVIEYCIAHKK